MTIIGGNHEFRILNDHMYVFEDCIEFDQFNSPIPNKIYLYLINENNEAINAVVGKGYRIPYVGEKVMFIMPNELNVDTEWPGKVITKAEYETWHAFVKA